MFFSHFSQDLIWLCGLSKVHHHNYYISIVINQVLQWGCYTIYTRCLLCILGNVWTHLLFVYSSAYSTGACKSQWHIKCIWQGEIIGWDTATAAPSPQNIGGRVPPPVPPRPSRPARPARPSRPIAARDRRPCPSTYSPKPLSLFWHMTKKLMK